MELDFSVLEKLNTKKEQPKANSARMNSVLFAEQQERQQIRDAYKELQQNIKRSEMLRSEILKGAKGGRSASELLVMAADCISLMTNQPDFSKQLQDDLKLLDAITSDGDSELLPDRKHRLHLIKRCVEQALEEC